MEQFLASIVALCCASQKLLLVNPVSIHNHVDDAIIICTLCI